jgi:Glycosyl transferase family 2
VGEEAVLKPKLSILLPATHGLESVRAALQAWDAQTRRDQLEILILCPTPEEDAGLSAGHVIVPTGSRDLHEARAWGALQASGDYVMLAEDHCLPDPDWTETMLERLDEGWDAIGPALRPGDRTTMWAEGSFLIGYGEWMQPVDRGPIGVLCGWNVLIRTDLLRERAERLPRDLILGSFLTRDLALEGRKFFLENRAEMRHFDPPGGSPQMKFVYIVGLGFGAIRTAQWPRIGQLLYPLAAPVIAALHWRRAIRQYRRAGRACRLRTSSVFSSMILALAWALGEAVGAARGLAAVTPRIKETEIKPVRPEVVARSDATEALMRMAPSGTNRP